MSSSKWNPELYGAKHAFVWEKAKGLLHLLAPQKGERVLDVGCGTGQLTSEIAALGAEVLGVDSSAEMIDEARRKFPGLRFDVCDARTLPFQAEFDAVFSNAALHWILEAEQTASGLARVLKPGGRFVAEFGGRGNVQNVVNALESALREIGIEATGTSLWFFPSIAEYASLLEKCGLEVREAMLFDRPTPLEDGEHGLATWVTMFCGAFLQRVPESLRANYLSAVARLARPTLWKTDHWELDYRRLRILAWKSKP